MALLMLTLLATAAVVRSFTLLMRFLQYGIAYLRHGRMVMDWAMPIQGLAVAAVAVASVRFGVHRPLGIEILPLSLLGAAGGMGIVVTLAFFMHRSSMTITIKHNLPLYLRDRTPGCRSTRRVTVYVGGPESRHARSGSALRLRLRPR